MNDIEHPTLETLFENLDRWRHLAGYPLEARVDGIMALFLPRVIKASCNVAAMNPRVIPQFPLKKHHNNRSYKVDFFALSKDRMKAFLIEVKTDMGSLRKGQLDYLDGARQKGFAHILSELRHIAKASSGSRRKYLHLLGALAEMDLMGVPIELEEMMRCGKTRGSSQLIDEIEVRVPVDSTIEVVFVQPRMGTSEKRHSFKHIDFEEFADIIGSSGELGDLLARYLTIWRKDPAVPPSGDA